jgi:phosphate:Na+ symporter
MLNGLLTVIRTNDAPLARQIRRMDDDVDGLYTAIKLYLTQIGREALDERDARRWAEIISFTINMEHVGDILERILDDLVEKKIAQRLEFSDAGMIEICDMHTRVLTNLRLGMNVFLNGDMKSAQRLLATKVELRKLQQQYADTHLRRLAGQTVQSIETSSLHLDIISDMRRINSFFCSTAYPILEAAGKLRRSRLRGSSDATGLHVAQPQLSSGGDLATPIK